MPQIPLIALELLIGFGVPLAWGVWQLIDLRREKVRDARRRSEEMAALPDDAPRE